MLISSTRNSNYPFVNSCDLDLGTGNTLERGVIFDAKLYPDCPEVDYAYISYIGVDSSDKGLNKGLIVVSANTVEEAVCTVSFDLTAETSPGKPVVGTAKHHGKICGHIYGTSELLPVLRGRYCPSPTSFIFTPSAFLPRPQGTSHYTIIDTAGSPVTAITFDTDPEGSGTGATVFKIDDDDAVTLNLDAEEGSGTPSDVALPLTRIGVVTPESSEPAYITPDPGGNIVIRSARGGAVRVVPTAAGLILGAYKDV